MLPGLLFFMYMCIRTLACQTLAWWDVLEAAGSVALLVVCCLLICFITWADRKIITTQHLCVGLAVFLVFFFAVHQGQAVVISEEMNK